MKHDYMQQTIISLYALCSELATANVKRISFAQSFDFYESQKICSYTLGTKVTLQFSYCYYLFSLEFPIKSKYRK